MYCFALKNARFATSFTSVLPSRTKPSTPTSHETKQTLLGDLPLLEYDEFTTDPLVPGHINITETSAGVAEVQKVVISSDAGFVREVQSLALTADDTSVAVSGSFNITLSGASNTVLVPFDANATELEVSLCCSQTTTVCC